MITRGLLDRNKQVVSFVANLFRGVGVVAGGSIVSVINKLPINDIDVFVTNPLVTFNEVMSILTPYMTGSILPRSTELRYSQYVDITVPVVFGESVEVQINIISKGDIGVTDVLLDFDFVNCAVYWDTTVQRPVGNLSNARIGTPISLQNIKHPVKTIERMVKYTGKGFTIDETTRVQLAKLYLVWYKQTDDTEALKLLERDYLDAGHPLSYADAVQYIETSGQGATDYTW